MQQFSSCLASIPVSPAIQVLLCLVPVSNVLASNVPVLAPAQHVVLRVPSTKVPLKTVPSRGKPAEISPVPPSPEPDSLPLVLTGSAPCWSEEADSSSDSKIGSRVSQPSHVQHASSGTSRPVPSRGSLLSRAALRGSFTSPVLASFSLSPGEAVVSEITSHHLMIAKPIKTY